MALWGVARNGLMYRGYWFQARRPEYCYRRTLQYFGGPVVHNSFPGSGASISANPLIIENIAGTLEA